MRTQYFTRGDSIKRLTNDTVTEYYSEDAGKWKSSTYDANELRDPEWFTRVSRDEARKKCPAAFRSPKKAKVTVVAAIPGVVVHPNKPGIELANKIRLVVAGMDYNGSQKIRAIKAICLFGLNS